jgi:hypothetical protein
MTIGPDPNYPSAVIWNVRIGTITNVHYFICWCQGNLPTRTEQWEGLLFTTKTELSESMEDGGEDKRGVFRLMVL